MAKKQQLNDDFSVKNVIAEFEKTRQRLLRSIDDESKTITVAEYEQKYPAKKLVEGALQKVDNARMAEMPELIKRSPIARTGASKATKILEQAWREAQVLGGISEMVDLLEEYMDECVVHEQRRGSVPTKGTYKEPSYIHSAATVEEIVTIIKTLQAYPPSSLEAVMEWAGYRNLQEDLNDLLNFNHYYSQEDNMTMIEVIGYEIKYLYNFMFDSKATIKDVFKGTTD